MLWGYIPGKEQEEPAAPDARQSIAPTLQCPLQKALRGTVIPLKLESLVLLTRENEGGTWVPDFVPHHQEGPSKSEAQ